jgi:GT2 family glycosyltransferase
LRRVRDWCHPRSWRQAEAQEFETDYITEGAAAFRREVFDRIEPYWPLLFIGHEGFDLSLRLLDAGYEIWYAPEVKVWHMASIETRPNWRPFYYYTRNLFPVICRNYPWAQGLLHLAPRLAVLAVRSLQAGAFRRYLAGLVDGLRMIPQTRALRRPIRQETLRKIAALRRCQPGLLERFATAKDRLMPLSPRT